MSNKFSTEGVAGQESAPSKWMKAPCVAEATIVDAKYVELGKKNTPALKMVFMTPPVRGVSHEYGNGQIGEGLMWLTENAFDRTQNNIILMCTKTVNRKDQLNAATSNVTNEAEFGEAVAEVLKGITGFFLFGAEEVWIKDKETGEYGDKPWLKPMVATIGAFVRPEEKKGDLIDRLEKYPDTLIKKSEKPAGTSSPVEESDW